MEASGSANPFGALLGFWMLIQLVVVLGLLLGGLYALFCLHRMAANLERVASALEEQAARNANIYASSGPPVNVEAAPVAYAPPMTSPATPQPPFQSTLRPDNTFDEAPLTPAENTPRHE